MIVEQRELNQLRSSLSDKRLVYTSGSFDLLHTGHLELLEWSKKQADLFVVGLNSDEVIRRKKGALRPVVGLLDRLQVINALRMVDYVFVIEGDDPALMPWIEAARQLEPEVCVLGPDWGDKEKNLWTQALPEAEVLISPPRIGRSTTSMISSIIATQTDK